MSLSRARRTCKYRRRARVYAVAGAFLSTLPIYYSETGDVSGAMLRSVHAGVEMRSLIMEVWGGFFCPRRCWSLFGGYGGEVIGGWVDVWIFFSGGQAC